MFQFLDTMHFEFDIKIVEFFNKLTDIKFFEILFKGISLLGTETVFIVLIGLTYWAIDKKLAKDVALPAFFGLILGNVVKGFVKRLRPFQQSPSTITCRDSSILATDSNGNFIMEDAGYYKTSSSSFPSGHSIGASGLYNGYALNLKKYKVFWIISTVLCLLVMLSRLALGVHFLTDVLTGYALGLCFILAYNYVITKVNRDIFDLSLLIFFGLLTIGSIWFSDKPKDIFSMYGAVLGLFIGVKLENKYVNFKMTKIVWKTILRFVIGLVLLFAIKELLKMTYKYFVDSNTILYCFLDLIRYTILLICAAYVYPLIFNKLSFLNDKENTDELEEKPVEA